MAPWVHFAVRTDGAVTPCCEAKGTFGHFADQPVEAIWHGPALRDFRATLLRDEPDLRCRKCYDAEASGGVSLRHSFNRVFAARFAERIPPAAGDPLKPPPPISLDIRFSNLCNFSCRMCWHGSSSKWFADARKLGWTAGPDALIAVFPTSDAGVQAVRPLLDTVEEIYFAGGEPLLYPEHAAILETLLTLGRTAVRLRYTSNLSELCAGGHDVLDLWRHFSNVHLEVSADAEGPRGELIRRGLSWPRLVVNLRAVRQRCPHVRISFGVTVSVFNVMVLPELHRALVALEVCGAHDFHLHPLQESEMHSIRILPRRLKRRAARRLLNYARSLPAAGSAVTAPIQLQLQHVVDHMLSMDRSALVGQFRDTTLRVDRLRGEATARICPELAPLLRIPFHRRAYAALRRSKLGRSKLRRSKLGRSKLGRSKLGRAVLHRLRSDLMGVTAVNAGQHVGSERTATHAVEAPHRIPHESG
jgi:MoaA/NifB/PqqE/SkfB family radical SAM enzyme